MLPWFTGARQWASKRHRRPNTIQTAAAMSPKTKRRKKIPRAILNGRGTWANDAANQLRLMVCQYLIGDQVWTADYTLGVVNVTRT